MAVTTPPRSKSTTSTNAKHKVGRRSLAEFVRFCDRIGIEVEQFQRVMLKDYFAGVAELVIIIPKKNGKTTLMAALALYHLVSTDNADVAVVASTGKQAMKLFDTARTIVYGAPWLDAQVKVLRGYREIRRLEDPDNPKRFRGFISVYAADADTADGWGGTLALVDELHRQKSSDLYGVLRDGLGPREGQLVCISTAGDTEDSPLGDLRAKAYGMPGMKQNGVHKHVRSKAFAMHEWGMNPKADRDDLGLVKEANPASWITLEELDRRKSSPSMTPEQWARFACGVWGLGAEKAFDPDRWASLAKPALEIEEGRQVTLGFDGARRRDTTALVACDIETGHLVVVGTWERPVDADSEWEVPESEVEQTVDYAFAQWDVWRLYGDPPWWESALDHWAGKYGADKVVRWWTNRIKSMAIACRAFQNDQVPERMSHSNDLTLNTHIANAVRNETKMMDNGEPLWFISKDSRASPRKIDAAMAAILAWQARLDALQKGALEEPTYAAASWQ